MTNGSRTKRRSNPAPTKSGASSPASRRTAKGRRTGSTLTSSSAQYLAQSLHASQEIHRVSEALLRDGWEEVMPGEFLSPSITAMSKRASPSTADASQTQTERRRRLISEREELLAKLAGLKKVREWMRHQKD